MRTFFTWIAVVLIAAIAYTYGAKAGKDRYREIVATVGAVWNDPRMKKARKRARKQTNKAAKAASNRVKQLGR